MFVDAPVFHVAPSQGWVNDPNGPLFYNGRYHLFYQHLSNSACWSWGLSWGHVSSSNLVHWTRHPPALLPAQHGSDSDGCFSGCAAVLPASEAAAAGLAGRSAHAHAAHAASTATGSNAAAPAAADTGPDAADAGADVGVPVLLYTGVVLRPDRDPSVRPSSLAVSELCIERQLAAVAADAGDPFLLQWRKLPGSWLPAPPPGLCLNCFRDPFILEQPCPCNGHTWRVMVGAGIRQPGTGLPCAGDAAPAAAACADGKHSTGWSVPAAAGRDAAAAAAAGVEAAARAGPRRAGMGTALVYSSKQLLSGWQYEGPLCTASRAEQGVVWECPVLAPVPLQQRAAEQQGHSSSFGATAAQAALSHLFSISCGPRGSGLPGCVYWLGRYAGGKFDLPAAAGPTLLDLGDLLYAPNLLTVPDQVGSECAAASSQLDG
ncbi:glycosyl hydrolases family 32 N-terminal domain-containing protein [Scenedesmus sp. NREL 46B-D3]|nr:glycosyl hydrolases family 32 N-terminal domain-containing protein [Scenedesmus sp. NREL 46B-D3]